MFLQICSLLISITFTYHLFWSILYVKHFKLHFLWQDNSYYWDSRLRWLRSIIPPPPHPTPAATPLPVTTKRLMVPHLTNSRGLMDLEDPTLVLYSLLALCMVLLFSSLSLALAVLMRRSRVKSSKPRPKEAKQKPAVQPGEKLSSREEQLGQTSKG